MKHWEEKWERKGQDIKRKWIKDEVYCDKNVSSYNKLEEKK